MFTLVQDRDRGIYFPRRTSQYLTLSFLSKTNEWKFLTRPNVQRFVDDDPGRLVISRYNFYLYCMWITLLVASTRFSHYSKIICQRVASIVHVIDVITLKYKRIHILFSGTGWLRQNSFCLTTEVCTCNPSSTFNHKDSFILVRRRHRFQIASQRIQFNFHIDSDKDQIENFTFPQYKCSFILQMLFYLQVLLCKSQNWYTGMTSGFYPSIHWFLHDQEA